MPSSRPITFLAAAAAIPLIALAVAGCGGSSNNNGSRAAITPPKTAGGQSATIGLESDGGLGKILVDSQGRTLYLFQKDQGTKSACTGACATAWPPLRDSGKPVAGGGANASMVGTTPRSDGKPQVTYNGHPLYLFQGDSSPGQANGQGVNAFGAKWYVVSSAGNAVTAMGSSSGGGNGY
jgi:predicted lipoprotein with Yx(FWY)xxD motif